MRCLFLAAVAAVAGLSGCSTPARYVEQGRDSGVVAIPANTDDWPSHNRREAIALIEKHVGPNYEIVDEREIVKGQQTQLDQQSNRGISTTTNLTEWQIAYRARGAGSSFSGTLPGTAPATPNVIQQTQYQSGSGGVRPAGGIVPNVGPSGGVVPAVGSFPVQPQQFSR